MRTGCSSAVEMSPADVAVSATQAAIARPTMSVTTRSLSPDDAASGAGGRVSTGRGRASRTSTLPIIGWPRRARVRGAQLFIANEARAAERGTFVEARPHDRIPASELFGWLTRYVRWQAISRPPLEGSHRGNPRDGSQDIVHHLGRGIAEAEVEHRKVPEACVPPCREITRAPAVHVRTRPVVHVAAEAWSQPIARRDSAPGSAAPASVAPVLRRRVRVVPRPLRARRQPDRRRTAGTLPRRRVTPPHRACARTH